MNRAQQLKDMIQVAHGVDYYKRYVAFSEFDSEKMREPIDGILSLVPIIPGACAAMSASLAAFLNERYNIPAVAVAGNLSIQGKTIFKYSKSIPTSGGFKNWDGHCWVEISNRICDVSIFRTAYAIERPSVLKAFILDTFGYGRGALLMHFNHLNDIGMDYLPKAVLNRHQISALMAGLDHRINGTKLRGIT